MGTKGTLDDTIKEAIDNLEFAADEVRLKLHLASMDARALWERTLEPRLLDARDSAREATEASKKSIEDTLEAVKKFAQELR